MVNMRKKLYNYKVYCLKTAFDRQVGCGIKMPYTDIRDDKVRFDLISILTIIEIEIHSTLATFLLGAEYRFMLYTVAMVPAAFYLTSTFAKGARHIRLSVFLSAIVILCYFLVDFFEPGIMPIPVSSMASA